jgi:ABC-type dipeptide/oligopeptide/nickel transport system permease component
MFQKVLRRIISTIIVLVGVSIMAFLLVRLGGGDPAKLLLPVTATEEQLEKQRQLMGLNDPYV